MGGKKTSDNNTMDMFNDEIYEAFDVPHPVKPSHGALSNVSHEISHIMSEALKLCTYDRYEVAMRMSQYLGEDVSKNMLDAYSAESREDHKISLQRALAFDFATDTRALLDFFSSKQGCLVLVGKDALLAKLGKLDEQELNIKKQKHDLKAYLNRN